MHTHTDIHTYAHTYTHTNTHTYIYIHYIDNIILLQSAGTHL